MAESPNNRIVTEKLSTPLRIFLSYGHDGNEELVRCIKADLEKRGHDVWFDKDEIKSGDEWRRSITEGIIKSNKFISFLSKHSTRDPGVCRDEIAIAIGVKGGNIQTILVESEQEVQPPVNIGHIQWLDMHDWKEQRAAGEAAWEQWYQAKLTEIVRVVESDESRRFAGEIETLNGHLKPIKSEARICQLLSKGFYGRRWLFEAVENWRTASKDVPSGADSRLFWIVGAPGVGKSAFAAQLTHTRGDTVIAAQFCEWDKPDHRNAPRVVRSLAFQIATRLPDYRKLLLTLPEIAELDRKDAAELFDYLLANPLRSVIHGGRDRYLIVIDALDEAGEAGRNPLVEMLARNAPRLPDWLGLVVTSRPEFDVKIPLQVLNPFPLDTQSKSNRADIHDYLRRELATQLQNRPDTDRLVEQILEKSEGVFLYVERFCDDVQHGHVSLDRPEQFPQGLGGIFCQYFQRQFPDLEKFRKDVRPALRAILAAREPLPVEILQRLFNWQDEELRDFTRPLASLFPVAKENGCDVIKPYHKSLLDWLTDEAKAGAHFVSVKEGHRALCNLGWQSFESNGRNIFRYFLAHLPKHLLACADWPRITSLLTNIQFLEAKYGAGMVFETILDFREAVELLPAELPECSILRFLEEAFQREIHFIARHVNDYPQALFQCLWNSCWWHDCPSAALHRETPTDNAPQATTDTGDIPKLYRLMEQWRSVKQRETPNDVWVRLLRPPPRPLNSQVIRILQGHTRPVIAATFSPSGNWVASSANDGTVRLWNASTGNEKKLWVGYESGAPCLAFSPDNTKLVSGWWNGEIHVADVVSGEVLFKVSGERCGVLDLKFTSDGSRFVAAFADATAKIFDAHSGQEVLCVRCHSTWVWGIDASADGRFIVTGCGDGTIQVWDSHTGVEESRIKSGQSQINSVAFSPDGATILSAGGDTSGLGSRSGAVCLWSLASGSPIMCWEEGRANRTAVFSPNGREVAYEIIGGSIRIRDISNSNSIRDLRIGNSSALTVCSLDFSPDGRQLVVGVNDSLVYVLDAAKPGQGELSVGHKDSITSLEYSPDGSRIATASSDTDIRIWNSSDGTEVFRLRGHSDPIWKIKFWPSGETLVSVSLAEEIRTWDVKTGQCKYATQGMSEEDEDYMHNVGDSIIERELSLSDRHLETVVRLSRTKPNIAYFSLTLGYNGRAHPRLPQFAGAVDGQLVLANIERFSEEL